MSMLASENHKPTSLGYNGFFLLASTMSQLETAKLLWSENAAPMSSDYGDVYFSVDDGLRESEYVFLDHNRLAERFAALENHPSSLFTIIETGFGTGLNFSLTLALWQRCAPAQARLRYISIEKHPLTLDDLRRAYQHWPGLNKVAEQWLTVYPPLFPGRHICPVGNNVELWLALQDVSEALDELHGSLHPQHRQAQTVADAWFLDGFAPSKNPAMWQPALFQAMAELSGTGTSFATFTAAGIVKRGLAEVGFVVNKVAGFGRKRNMLCGHFEPIQTLPLPVTPKGHNATWYLPPQKAGANTVAILGAGVAAATLANALAVRGLKVSVFEKASEIAQNGSGNKQGVIYAKLSHRDELSARFVTSALHFAHHYYLPWFKEGTLLPGRDGDMCGVAHLLDSDNQALRETFAASPTFVSFHNIDDASQRVGAPLSKPAMLVHAGGWLYPRAFCQAAFAHPNIQLHLNYEAQQPVKTAAGWEIAGQTFDAVVVATGSQLEGMVDYLPIKPIRGQVSHIQSTGALTRLTMALCDKGYIAPAMDGQHCIGASFNLGLNDLALRQQDHRDNLDNLAQAIAGLAPELPSDADLDGRAAFRGTSPDYLPLVGGVVDPVRFCEDFAELGKDATREVSQNDSYHEGLYCLLGLGSKGLTYAPLCAEHLASLICGEASPLPLSQQLALNPNRFLLRAIIKNKAQKF